MKILAFIVCAALSVSAVAQDSSRHVAGKLTSLKKPPVYVMTQEQQKAAAMSSVALDLDADPNEIICQKEEVGSFGSKLKVKRCKTRAERREEAKRELARNGRDIEDYKRRASTRQSSAQAFDTRTENRNRVRRRGN